MKRRISSFLLLALGIVTLSSCTGKNTLLFLNWGEYIDESLLEEFEDEYNCTVVMDLAESNEAFYSKVSSGTTVYDLVCPSDYMVLKMKKNDLLAEIDFSQLNEFKRDNLLHGVKGITSSMEEIQEGISSYFVPYLWGTWGMMYSTNKIGLKEAVLSSDNEWSPLFHRGTLPTDTRVGMYDSNQHAYYAACKYLGLDNTKELSDAEWDKVYTTVEQMQYNAWGTDDLKKKIAAGNLDLGFMWTGDFLYYYCERIAALVDKAAEEISNLNYEEMLEALIEKGVYTKDSKNYKIGFDLFIPEDTIAFCDNLVITKNAAHKDLAHLFINFLCRQDNAYKNAYYVMYDTPFQDVHDEMEDLKVQEFNDMDFDRIYDFAIGYGVEKYYPKKIENGKGYKGDILASFERKYINKINAKFNNARI